MIKVKLPRATIHKKRKGEKMNIDLDNERTQGRFFTLVIIAVVVIGLVEISSQIRQCNTSEEEAVANCLSAGGDAFKCCRGNKSVDNCRAHNPLRKKND